MGANVFLWFAVAGFVLSFIGMLTTKQVSELLAPTKESFFAIPRTILSMMWFVGGQLICLVFMLCSLLVLSFLM